MPKEKYRTNANSIQSKMKDFVCRLNEGLDGNFVVAFQFISLDRVNGQNLVWHLYSVRKDEYINATEKFIGLTKEKKVKRTVLNLEYEDAPYWLKELGDSKVIKIPLGKQQAQEFISKLDYSYYRQELEFDINTPPQSEPAPNRGNSLTDLMQYWLECLQERMGEGGSLMWVSQRHASSSLGRITSSAFCLFNEKLEDKSPLAYRLSKLIREFIIDHNIDLYIAPEKEKVQALTDQVRKLHISDQELIAAIKLENPSVVFRRQLEQRLIKIRRAFDTTIPILITGETGTGKEIIARIIHQQSGRPKLLFMPLNCAGFSEGDMLIDSHLFGHAKGAFTGATEKREGYFKKYSKGTIFLDEIQHLPRGTQGKLKRVIEYKEFTPVGLDNVENTETRLIFAANQNLIPKVRSEDFLEDLFYRISVIQIHIPPLRERMDEIDELINAFINKYNSDFPFKVNKSLDRAAISKLKAYEYPGNIRELQNVLLRAYIISADSPHIGAEHILFDEVKQIDGKYHIRIDANRPKQAELAKVLKCLKLSIDDLLIKDPNTRITRAKVLKNMLNLSEEFRLPYTPENLKATYLKDGNKQDILKIVKLNEAYLRGSLMKLKDIASWLQEQDTES